MADVPQRSRRSHAERRPFVLLYVDQIQQLLAEGLGIREYRLLLALTEQMDDGRPFHWSNKTAVATIGNTSTPRVSEAMRALKDHGVVLEVGPVRNRIILNPRYVWRGSARDRIIMCLQLRRTHPYAMRWWAPTIEELDDARRALEAHPDTEPVPEEDR